MEDVLDVYHRPPDPPRPLVCFDELSKQLTKEVRAPLPPTPGQPAREDSEYERNGAANLFLACAPLLGWRHVKVTARRTRLDWARLIRDLVDVHFPGGRADRAGARQPQHPRPGLALRGVPAGRGQADWDRLELHHTPKHGSWLNVAEIELSVLGRQCLDRRIPDQPTLTAEVAAWEAARNAERVTSTGSSRPTTPASSSSTSTPSSNRPNDAGRSTSHAAAHRPATPG